MSLLLQLKQEHEVIEGVLLIFNKLIAKLGRAKAVNLAHLEGVLTVWRDYLCREHLEREEIGVFPQLEKVNTSLLAEMVKAHEALSTKLSKLEESVKRLRAGRANAGRELVRLGEDFSWSLESHLRQEKQVFATLAEEEKGKDEPIVKSRTIDRPITGEQHLRFQRLSRIIHEISDEYLGRTLSFEWEKEEERESEGAWSENEVGPLEGESDSITLPTEIKEEPPIAEDGLDLGKEKAWSAQAKIVIGESGDDLENAIKSLADVNLISIDSIPEEATET